MEFDSCEPVSQLITIDWLPCVADTTSGASRCLARSSATTSGPSVTSTYSWNSSRGTSRGLFFDLQDELSHLFRRSVDLHTPQSLSRYFRDRVLQTAEDQFVAV